MSIAAIKMIQAEIREKLSARITVDAMEAVQDALADVLARYEISMPAAGSGGPDYALEAYLDAMDVEGRSAKTVERYRYNLTRLFAGCQADTRSITVYHIRRYFADEKARGIADSTIRGLREICSAYFGWCLREGLISKSPVANIGAIKIPKVIRQAYSEVEMEKLNRSCRSARDRAIVGFLAATGCRISEMTSLDRDAVDLERMECTVVGKGNKERRVYIDPVTCMALREYLDERQDDKAPLFLGRGGERLLPNGVRVMLKKLGADAGVEHVHPHRFRRTRATTLVRHGMPIEEVASILGHEKVDTTMRYVVLDQSQIRRSYEKYA